MARAQRLFERRLKDPYRIRKALDRLTPDCSGHGVPLADVVIEAIYENADTKRALYAELEPRMRADALLATEGTPAETLSRALAFARHIDKLPLPVRSSPGFLVNRVLMPYLLEAVTLLEEGHARETIDAAALQFGMPMGRIELADTVGLDICLSVAEELVPVIGGSIPARLREHVDAGKLGRKTGQGFYGWQRGRAVHAKRVPDRVPLADLAARMIDRLVNESVACLRDGVVEDADLVDAGVIFGTGFAPFRGGPMNYLRTHDTDRNGHVHGGEPAHA